MKTYYVGNIPFNGEDSISHGRTKGSKNGISHTPGYVAIGELAGKVSTAARSVGNKVSGVARSAGRTVKKTYSSGKEFITGGNARKNYKKAQADRATKMHTAGYLRNAWRENYEESKRDQARIGKEYRISQLHSAKDVKAGKRTRKLMNDYNEINERLQKDRDAKNFTERNYINVDASTSLAERRAREKYEKTLPGMVEKASRNLSKIGGKKMSEVNNWLSGAANSAYKTASGAAKKASSAVSSAANSAYKTASGAAKKAYSSVSKTLKTSGSKAISSIKTGASSTAGKVKNFLSGIFGKKKK